MTTTTKHRNRKLRLLPFFVLLFGTARAQMADTLAIGDPFGFSVRTLEKIRDQQPVNEELEKLAALRADRLAALLNTDDKRKAFWINIYNIAIQAALQKDSTLIQARAAFPEKNIIYVAGKHLSPDFILHRILRRSKNKYGLGYVNKLFITEYEKMFRVEFVDYRVHFAVNNGSASCGYIYIYTPENLNELLNRATVFFLHKEVVYNEAAKTAELPQMLEWYKADFGGEKGMLQFLEKLLIVPASGKTKLRYRDYDWRLRLGYFG